MIQAVRFSCWCWKTILIRNSCDSFKTDPVFQPLFDNLILFSRKIEFLCVQLEQTLCILDSCGNFRFCWREKFQRKNIHEVSGNVIRLLAAWMANSRWREGADSGSGGQFWKTARPRLRWEPWGCGRLLSLSPSLSVARALCRESKWFLSSPSPNPHTQHIWNESTIKGGQAKPIHTLFATWSKLM